MSALFSEILNMSLTGSVVIAFVLLARLALKKAPKIYSYALWAVVLFRLLCPVSLPSPVGLLNVVQPETTQSEGITTSVSYLPVEYVYSGTDDSRLEAAAPIPETVEKVKPTVSALQIAAYVWLAGAALMAIYSAVTYLRLRWQLVGAILWRGNVWLADHIASPFVLGFLRPRIYLPSHTEKRERRWIVAHERHHIRRFDHIIKLLAYAALCLHWFNPLAWAAFLLAGKDMEMSCDEAVIKKLGSGIRADYCASLLRMATHKSIISGMPLAFGEGDTKGRVKNMAAWRKPKLWVSVLCGILCIAILAACALNPAKAEDTSTDTDLPKVSIDYSDLTMTMPTGCDYRFEEGELNIYDGAGQKIGGVIGYAVPENIDWTNDSAWLDTLVWESVSPGLAYSGGSSLYGDWDMHFESDALWRYVPALALYGKRTYTYANGAVDCLDNREIHLMTVSALDGSILNSFADD